MSKNSTVWTDANLPNPHSKDCNRIMNQLFKLIYKFPGFIIGRIVFRAFGGAAYARFRGARVGIGCRIYIKDLGSEPFLVTIGDNVTVTAGVKILTHDGSTGLVFDSSGERYFRYGPVKIGSNVFIGVNSIILPGVNIGSNVVIGAGSIVNRDIPPDTVVVGNPAKIVGDFKAFEEKVRKSSVSGAHLKGPYSYRQRVRRAIDLASTKS